MRGCLFMQIIPLKVEPCSRVVVDQSSLEAVKHSRVILVDEEEMALLCTKAVALLQMQLF